jgi:hypothetical protein
VSLAFPSAVDGIEAIQDGIDGIVAADWNELSAAVESVQSEIGLDPHGQANYPTLKDLLTSLVRIASGSVTADSASFAVGAGVNISFPAGTFSNSANIAIVVGRATSGAFSSTNPDDATQPIQFAVRGITTTAAQIYGYRPTGADPTGTTQVTVGWTAFELRTAPGGTEQFISIAAIPSLVDAYDEAKEDLPNALMDEVEEAAKALGTNPHQVRISGNQYADIASMLDQIAQAFSGRVSGSSNDFFTGPGVEVRLPGEFFPVVADVQIQARMNIDTVQFGPIGGGGAGQSDYPADLIAVNVRLDAGTGDLVFNLYGYNRNGAQPASTSAQITVAWHVRRKVVHP